MAYSLKLDEERVVKYLRNFAGLSREVRVRLFTNLDVGLREHADSLREDLTLRVAPDSEYFWYHLILKDNQGDGRVRLFSFIVNDAAAVYGVLQVEYVQVIEAS